MYIPILPKHVWKDITFEQAATGRIDLDQAIGTGPFRITEFEPKQVVVLEAFDEHWGGTPQIDRLVYQFFDNDEAQVNSLLAGQVDYLNNAPPSLYPALEGAPGITVNVATGGDFTELGFNNWDPTPERFEDEGCADCPKGPTTGSMGDPWITIPAVRAALAGLIDKAALVEFAQGGFGTPGVSIASPVDPLFAYQPNPDDPATFPAYADGEEQAAARTAAADRFSATMAEFGFEDTDGNGILNVPATDEGLTIDPENAGSDWSLRLFVREDDEEDKLAGQLIEQWFESAGVDVAYEEVSEDPRLYDGTYPSASNADYDMFIWAWGPDPDPDFILSVLTCSQINGWQDANYCDPEYDQLYDQQHATLDREARAALVQQMLAKQYSEAPYAVLWNTNQIEAYATDRWIGLDRMPAETGLVWPTIGFGPYGSALTVAPADGS
jgi:peptide/nickel transport system substrate-binding protein